MKKIIFIFIIIIFVVVLFFDWKYFFQWNILIPIPSDKIIISEIDHGKHKTHIAKWEYNSFKMNLVTSIAKKIDYSEVESFVINSDVFYGTSEEKIEYKTFAMSLINEEKKYIINCQKRFVKKDNSFFCDPISIIIVDDKEKEVYELYGT